MKPSIVIFLIGLFYSTAISETTAQKITCQGNSYSSEIVSKKVISETCVEYEIKVSYDGSRSFGLSHLSVAIPCGEVKNVSNSENWKQVLGKDPTTGINGLKIDDIKRFGENGADSFTIKFTWCSGASCDKTLSVVAYKAGQCIDYSTLKEGGVKTDGDKDKDDGKDKRSCGNPSHDHSKDGGGKDGSCGNDGKDKDKDRDKDKDGDGKDKGDKGGCTNPSHDHSKDGGGKDGSCGNNNNGSQKPTCDGNSFSSEIISKKIVSPTCIDYEIKVSYDGTRTFGLSHYSIGIPCGEVINISNSENWKQVFGKDPTTGVFGLKIDDIGGFGDNGADSFTIKFRWCSDASCEKKLAIVSYKAGQCVDYDSLQDDGNGETGGGTDGDGGNTGGGGGNDGTDGGDTGGGDGTDGGGDTGGDNTCSTLLAALQKVNTGCSGSNTGQLQVIIQDGQEPYTYTWSTGQTSASIQNLPEGNYTVSIKDANNNIMTLSETISAPPPIVIAESITHPTCTGFSNGAINLMITGGSGPYTFAWSNGSTQQNISGLGSGTYTVSVTDVSGCVVQKTFSLTNTTSIIVGVAFTHPLCGQSNGTIDITPNGGVAPYNYLWSTGVTTQDLQNGAPGTYSVKVTDATGCSVDMVYALRVNNSMVLKYVVTPTTCADNSTGAINLTVTGGTAPYTYLWQDGGITNEDRTGLKAGLYKVTVTDAGGCSSAINISVFKKTFTVNSEITQPLCAGDTGAVTLTPVDGVSPYTYTWSNGDTDNSISGVSDGTYSVTVTDASGCSINMVFLVTSPLAISATNTVSNTQCGNEGAYSIDVSVVGGKAPYIYTWSNGATTQDISGVNSGNYSVKITDMNGCSVTQQIVVTPVATSWSCLINQPSVEVVCKSAGNLLSTSVLGASSYQWSVTSSDNSWTITAGSNSAAVIFTAGNAGSSATFSLTITQDGCTKTCVYTTTTNGCIEKDNTGGGDPLSGDPCASDSTASTPPSTSQEPGPTTNETQGQTSGEAPTDASDEAGEETSEDVDESLGESRPDKLKVCAYPNPFTDRITFEWTSQEDDYAQVEIMDLLGRRASVVFSGEVRKGQSYKCDWTPSDSEKIYVYRFNSSHKTEQGKLFKK